MANAACGDLEDPGQKLPEADFTIESSDEDDNSRAEGGVCVFSRSEHLHSIGISDTGSQLGYTDHTIEANILSTQANVLNTTATFETAMCISTATSEMAAGSVIESKPASTQFPLHSDIVARAELENNTEVDWEKFKCEFTNALQSLDMATITSDSSVHVAQDSKEGETFRHQLLIDTILSLHADSKPGMQNDTASQRNQNDLKDNFHDTTSDDVTTECSMGAAPVINGSLNSSSPGRLRSSILTVGALETIHEAELDRALDSVSPPSVEDTPTGRIDSDSIPHESLPVQTVAWNEAIERTDLLSRLEKLHVRTGMEMREKSSEQDDEVNVVSIRPEVYKPETTIYVDLRGSRHGTREEGVVSSSQPLEISLAAQRLLAARGTHDDSSSDEASDDGDAYSWLKQRASVKAEICGSTPSHPHNLHHPHKSPPTLTHSQVQITNPPTLSHGQAIGSHDTAARSCDQPSDTRNQAFMSHDQSVGSHDQSEMPVIESNRERFSELKKVNLGDTQNDSSSKVAIRNDSPIADIPGTQRSQVANTDGREQSSPGKAAQSVGGLKGVQLRPFSKLQSKRGNEQLKIKFLEKQKMDHVSSEVDHMTSGVDHMILKVSSGSSLSEEDVNTTATVVKPTDFNPASLSLSSSFSEDGTSEEITGTGTNKREPLLLDETPPTSPTKTPSGKNKASKKSKKGQKKKKAQNSENRPHKRRQRFRSDSLTTSSDEEHDTSQLPAGPQSSGSHFSRLEVSNSSSVEEQQEYGIERLKVHLQQRISSRKPPAHFETPAAEPVFHEDVSFSPVMSQLDPAVRTDALLVLPLTDSGLLQLPDPLSELGGVAAMKTLHTLVLTGLACAVCEGSGAGRSGVNGNVENGSMENGSMENGNGKIENGDLGGESVESSGSEVFVSQNGIMENENSWNGSLEDCDSKTQTLPFKITGLQQTILDGNPAILIAVATPQIREHKPDSNYDSTNAIGLRPFIDKTRDDMIVSELEAYLKQATLSTFLADVIPAVRHLIAPAILDQIEPFLASPLEHFFTVQDDVSPLKSAVSFYWYSLYHPSVLPVSESLKSQTSLQSTVCTLTHSSLANPLLVYSTFTSIFDRALDLAGLRIVFGQASSFVDSIPVPSPNSKSNAASSQLPAMLPSSLTSSSSSTDSPQLPLVLPTLALAIRGPDAVFRWMEAVGPEDPSLAKITDPTSLSARFGKAGRGGGVIPKCVRTPYRALAAVARWFGGRACLKTASVLGISDAHTKSERRKRQRVRFSETQSESEDGLSSPVADVTFPPLVFNRPTLIVPRYSQVLFIMAPHIPPSCYSAVLTACSTAGFDIFGVKRLRLNTKRASALQISSPFMAHFTPSSTPPSPTGVEFVTHPLLTEHAQNSVAPLPSVIFLLGRENALLHSAVLKATAKQCFHDILKRTEVNCLQFITEDCLFHATEFTEDATKVIGSFTLPPSITTSHTQLDSSWEHEDNLREEIGFLAVPQSASLDKATAILDAIFDIQSSSTFEEQNMSSFLSSSSSSAYEKPEKQDFERFELIGFKVIPQLPRFHSKQLCPIPVDSNLYQQAVQLLSDVPATLLVLRGINCNKRLLSLTSASQKPCHSSSALKQKLSYVPSHNMQEAYRLSSIFFSDKELFTDLKSRVLAKDVPYSWLQDSAILHLFTGGPQSLFSVFTVDTEEIKFCLRVLERVSLSGFVIVAMANVESSNEDVEGVFENAESAGCLKLVVCVQRENAVWRLRRVLEPLTSSAGRYLSCSETFSSAVDDVKRYFPEGICCQPTSIATQFEISSLGTDDFTGFAHSKIAKFADRTGYTSPFMESTCVVMPPSLTAGGVVSAVRGGVVSAPFVEVLEMLVQAGFVLCRVKMALLSRESSEQLCRICAATKSNAEELTTGACLLAVLQRNNAAACFNSVLKSAMQIHLRGNTLPNMEALVSKMLVPQNPQEVKKVMEFFAIETEC